MTIMQSWVLYRAQGGALSKHQEGNFQEQFTLTYKIKINIKYIKGNGVIAS